MDARLTEEMPMRTACATLAIVLCLGAAKAAAETVDLAVVLAADVSRSVDDDEFQLQRQGYAAAVTDPRVLRAVANGQHGAIAVCFIEWSGSDEQQVVAEWTVIRDGETATGFATTLLSAPRSFIGRTSISAALDFGRSYFLKAEFATERRVIDVSGDGTNNSGRPVTAARDAAIAQNVTINGLVILSAVPLPTNPAHTNPPGGLTAYYENNVIGGPGAFVVEAEDFASFGQSLIAKLIKEIATAPARPHS
jgi:hypothetical protein